MTDTILYLTDSIVAQGNIEGGERAKNRQTYDDNAWICRQCIPNRFVYPGEDREAHIVYHYKLEAKNKQAQRDADEKARWLAKQKKKHASYELGAREFTLTYSPRWMSDAEAREQMKKAIGKLLKYHANEIVLLRAVGEVGSNGMSHIHCFYKLTGGLKITDKNFKRAWSYWNPKKPQGRGFEGGHHATVKVESDFLGYIEKDIDDAWLDITRPVEKNPELVV